MGTTSVHWPSKVTTTGERGMSPENLAASIICVGVSKRVWMTLLTSGDGKELLCSERVCLTIWPFKPTFTAKSFPSESESRFQPPAPCGHLGVLKSWSLGCHPHSPHLRHSYVLRQNEVRKKSNTEGSRGKGH